MSDKLTKEEQEVIDSLSGEEQTVPPIVAVSSVFIILIASFISFQLYRQGFTFESLITEPRHQNLQSLKSLGGFEARNNVEYFQSGFSSRSHISNVMLCRLYVLLILTLLLSSVFIYQGHRWAKFLVSITTALLIYTAFFTVYSTPLLKLVGVPLALFVLVLYTPISSEYFGTNDNENA